MSIRHPLDQFPGIAWDTYCPIRDLANYAGQRVITCGLIIADRSHHQVSGDRMKFITICDHTGIIECHIIYNALWTNSDRKTDYPTVRGKLEKKMFPAPKH